MAIYLDSAATTPMTAAAKAEYMQVAEAYPANPQGSYRAARSAMAKLDECRERCAAVLGCEPAAVYFTSGATESDNMAVTGRAHAGLVAASAVEHKAVVAPVLAAGGDLVPVEGDGSIDRDRFRAFLKERSSALALVSLMAVNNETGVSYPVEILAGMVRKHAPGALFHTDAVQAVVVQPLASLGRAADLVSLSAHKFGGPKGCGILVAKERGALKPLILGGSQERDLRPGTQDLAAIAAMTVALEGAQAGVEASTAYLSGLQQRFEALVAELVPAAIVSGAGTLRSPSITHLLLPGATSEELLFLLDEAGIAAAAGSACASGALEPSHVVLAMGVPAPLAKSSLRFSYSTSTSLSDIELAAKALAEAYRRLAP
ncbi:MAG: aminotransferase class V-fold PLP-dependent enzyme [Actinomycetota bacterium]|nr:aminotransferase class V-fold PLP-dependent enzyme [Actinomycetota bacterium]